MAERINFEDPALDVEDQADEVVSVETDPSDGNGGEVTVAETAEAVEKLIHEGGVAVAKLVELPRAEEPDETEPAQEDLAEAA